MLWFDVLAIGTPAMVLVMSAAYYAGRRRERREFGQRLRKPGATRWYAATC